MASNSENITNKIYFIYHEKKIVFIDLKDICFKKSEIYVMTCVLSNPFNLSIHIDMCYNGITGITILQRRFDLGDILTIMGFEEAVENGKYEPVILEHSSEVSCVFLDFLLENCYDENIKNLFITLCKTNRLGGLFKTLSAITKRITKQILIFKIYD